VWEAGWAQHPLDRALTMLAAAAPGQTRHDLALLTIGQRDGYLLDLYAQTFGPQLAIQAHCPSCAGQVEFTVAIGEIRVVACIPAAGPLTHVKDGYTLAFRLPNSLDLATIVQRSDAVVARRILAANCLLRAEHHGELIDTDALPEALIETMAAQMAEHDPQAEIELALLCPSCEQRWTLLFDIATFLWAKIDVQARRLLHEVHRLAQAYGWREADILAMSAVRRQLYLDMVG